jgi:hypothetical protein
MADVDHYDLLRRALGDDSTAAVSALWSQIDDPVRRFYYLKIMLDNNQGVSLVAQLKEDL